MDSDEDRVTVKRVVWSLEPAKREVERLNEVNAERYTPRMGHVTFDLDAYERDNDGTNRRLMEALA